MNRSIGLAVVALAAFALSFGNADNAQARLFGDSHGSNGGYGSSGGGGSHGSHGGWFGNGSNGGHGSRGGLFSRHYRGNGSHGSHGSNGGHGSYNDADHNGDEGPDQAPVAPENGSN